MKTQVLIGNSSDLAKIVCCWEELTYRDAAGLAPKRGELKQIYEQSLNVIENTYRECLAFLVCENVYENKRLIFKMREC